MPELKVTDLKDLTSTEEIDSLANRIDVNRVSYWRRLKYVNTRILNLCKTFEKSEITKESMIVPEDRENAEQFCILEAQRKWKFHVAIEPN